MCEICLSCAYEMRVFCVYVLWPRSDSSLSPAGQTDVDAKPSCHSFRYSLDFPSMGHCIIINNKNFDRRTGTFHALVVGSGAAKFEIETPAVYALNFPDASHVGFGLRLLVY